MEMNITPTFGYGELTAKVKWGKTPPATKYGALKRFQWTWRTRQVAGQDGAPQIKADSVSRDMASRPVLAGAVATSHMGLLRFT